MKNLMNDVTGVYLPLAAGGVASGVAKNLAKKVVKNTKVQAIAPVIVGAFLSRQKNPQLKFLGYGMIASGGRDVAGEMIPSLKGIEDMDLNGIFDDIMDDLGASVLNDNINAGVLNDDFDSVADEINDDLGDEINGDYEM